jgi:hypothetical protein
MRPWLHLIPPLLILLVLLGVAALLNTHVLWCRGRSIFVPPDRCGVVARGAEPSKSNSAASYGVINGFSSVTFQLAAAAMAHVSSAPWYKNGPPFRKLPRATS